MLLQRFARQAKSSLSSFGCRIRTYSATADITKGPRLLVERYAAFSTENPFICSILTAFVVLSSADITCQTLTRQDAPHDWERTRALSAWGTWHYGIPQKALYLSLDRCFTPQQSVLKTFIDVWANTPFHLIPSFYFVTGTLRGKELHEIYEQLKKEWLEAALGSVIYWSPIIWGMMAYVPQHSRILMIVVCSFFHKSWLSWVSNREAMRLQRAESAKKHEKKELAESRKVDAYNDSISSTVAA